MTNIPEGYTYIRCDMYSPEAFRERFARLNGSSLRRYCEEYMAAHPKDAYDTDDYIEVLHMKPPTVRTRREWQNIHSFNLYDKEDDAWTNEETTVEADEETATLPEETA